jgi:hypothetical protein
MFDNVSNTAAAGLRVIPHRARQPFLEFSPSVL